jgi:hypothetical protein
MLNRTIIRNWTILLGSTMTVLAAATLSSVEYESVSFDPLISFWKVSITSIAKMPIKPAGKALLNFLTDPGKGSVFVPDFL